MKTKVEFKTLPALALQIRKSLISITGYPSKFRAKKSRRMKHKSMKAFNAIISNRYKKYWNGDILVVRTGTSRAEVPGMQKIKCTRLRICAPPESKGKEKPEPQNRLTACMVFCGLNFLDR